MEKRKKRSSSPTAVAPHLLSVSNRHTSSPARRPPPHLLSLRSPPRLQIVVSVVVVVLVGGSGRPLPAASPPGSPPSPLLVAAASSTRARHHPLFLSPHSYPALATERASLCPPRVVVVVLAWWEGWRDPPRHSPRSPEHSGGSIQPNQPDSSIPSGGNIPLQATLSHSRPPTKHPQKMGRHVLSTQIPPSKHTLNGIENSGVLNTRF